MRRYVAERLQPRQGGVQNTSHKPKCNHVHPLPATPPRLPLEATGSLASAPWGIGGAGHQPLGRAHVAIPKARHPRSMAPSHPQPMEHIGTTWEPSQRSSPSEALRGRSNEPKIVDSPAAWTILPQPTGMNPTFINISPWKISTCRPQCFATASPQHETSGPAATQQLVCANDRFHRRVRCQPLTRSSRLGVFATAPCIFASFHPRPTYLLQGCDDMAWGQISWPLSGSATSTSLFSTVRPESQRRQAQARVQRRGPSEPPLPRNANDVRTVIFA